MPDAAVLAFGIVGLEEVLVKPFGPVQLHVAAPVEVVVAVNCNAAPLHTGALEESVGVLGGVGSDKVNGPASAEGQLLAVTLM